MSRDRIAYSLGVGVLTLLTFGILQALHVPSGNFIDWLIGIASFWWLLIIVTVPWNIYFEAREAIAEANLSQSKDLKVDPLQLQYIRRVSQGSLATAISLHLVSAIGLYALAATGVSVVGYASSGATLLLMASRPAIRLYQYLSARLSMIRKEIQYPREDVVELRHRFSMVEASVRELEEKLDPLEPHSWVATTQRDFQETRQNLATLRALLEQMQAKNEVEHQQLSREAKQAIAQLTEDSQVLGHVREIIQFFKAA